MCLIVVFLVVGFLIAFYACCACPSGQLDNAFRDDLDYTVEQEMKLQRRWEENE